MTKHSNKVIDALLNQVEESAALAEYKLYFITKLEFHFKPRQLERLVTALSKRILPIDMKP